MARLTVEGDYFLCPHCGADVRKGQAACPECGSCEETGWSDAATESFADGGDGEDDDFDYHEFLEREFPDHAQPLTARQKLSRLGIVLICLLLILTLIFFQ
jgi:hypothetical protein